MTALVSSTGLARVAPGEVDVGIAPTEHKADGAELGVIYFHAAGNPATQAIAAPGEMAKILRSIARAGYPIVSTTAGGDYSWGNDTAVARAADAKTFLQAAAWPRGARAGPVVLVGMSMGLLVALNYAKANPANVAAVIGFLGVIDLNDIHANNRGGYAASIDAAYGGTYVDATERGDHNPAYQATQGDHDTYPVHLWYATNDAICLPAAEASFAAAVGPTVTRYSLGAGGHADSALAAVVHADVVAAIGAVS